MDNEKTSGNVEQPRVAATTGFGKSSASLLNFFDKYNTVDGLDHDAFLDDFFKKHPGTCDLLCAICDTEPSTLDNRAIQCSPILQVCLILAGGTKSPRRLTKDEMRSIFVILTKLTHEDLAKPLDPYLHEAFMVVIYTQWHAVNYPRGITSTMYFKQTAWEKWQRDHGPVFTNARVISMLFALMRDIVLS